MSNARLAICAENSRLQGAYGRAFTLIELLVVVAIIALLLAILMPTLQRVQELGRNLVCLTNLRSIATAAALYAAWHCMRRGTQ